MKAEMKKGRIISNRRANAWLLAASVVTLLATKVYPESEPEEQNTDWSPPRAITVPADGGTVKGVVRIRPLPRKKEDEGEDRDPMEARKPAIYVKSLCIPRQSLLWVGASEYEHFFIIKDQIVALHPTAGADLSISILGASIPKSADADKAFREEMDGRFSKIAERPLRYQYWISLRRLFGQDAFVDEHDPRVPSVPTISGVSFDRGNAVVTLAEKNGKKSTLTFDGSLRVVAAARDGHSVPVPKPVAPRKLTTDKD